MKTYECQNECNRQRIHDFLEGDADQPDPVLTEQLEECEACREYFDLRVASCDEWSQIGQLLQPGKHDRATRIGFSAGSNAGQQARQSVSINEVLESLAPTDDPHSLGRVGKYEIKGVIGAGGMGVVLKAFEPSLDRVVAIKVLAPHLANNDKARRRFEREARAAAAVINPNVIPIYSVTNDGKLPYLVMACIQGGSLQQRLDNQGAASVPEVLRIGSQIASGLAAAHEQGLVHRDIKPENILFEGDVERIAITDFGLARAVDDNTLTQAGTIAGTPMYMSPEQARGEQVDPQSDLFSLGSVLYALCTGQPPYRADSSLGVMRKITDEAPVPIRELNPEMPQWLSDTIEKLMAKDKGDRFASASEVHDLLESCLSHVQAPETVPLPVQVLSSSRNDKPPIKTWTAVGFGGMLMGLIAAAVFFIVTNNGIVKVEVLDESISVAIDDPENVVVKEDGVEAMELRAGDDHKLIVSIGKRKLHTEDFEIRRNGEVTFRVELLKGEVVLSRDGKLLATKPMLGVTQPDGLENGNSKTLVAESPVKANERTFADLSDADLALVYKQITGAELATGFVSGSDLASSVNILLGMSTVSREKIAENLVKLGKPEVAKIVLSSGRVDPAATETLKLGNLLMESGNGAKAVDAWLTAYRIAPTLFDWKRIDTFGKHKRLKDLAEVFTEERIRKTRNESVTPLHFLLKRLMADDLRASVGMPFMERLWRARPNIRGWILDETKWDEVPNRADYFAELLIPADVEKVGDGWRRMYYESGVAGGWLYDMRKMIDKEAATQLLAKIKPVLEDHPKWIAGSATEVTLQAMAGNFEPAKQWIQTNFDTGQGSEPRVSLGIMAKYLGATLEGRDRELDEQIIKLYEHAFQRRDAKLPCRDSGVHGLARLYSTCGRQQEAIDLMYGLVDRERKVEEFLVENWGNPKTVNLDHERIWDLRTAVETLNSIGYPMDSLLLLSRVTFEQRRAAGIYKGGGWEYDDQRVDRVTSKSQKLLNTNSIVEAINRGVIPVGLASTINEKSGEIENPIVKLLSQVARTELSDEATAAFESVNAKLSDPDAMDQHLSDLLKQHPADMDIAVAATLFAFFKDDIVKAQKRLALLVSMVEANPQVRAADVGLHLVAEKAAISKETIEMVQKLANRAKRAGQQMSEPWQEFFEHRSEDDYTKEGAKRLIISAERLAARGDIDGAIDVYLKAYRLNPGSFDWNKIPFFKEAGRLAEVADCFDVAAIRSPLNTLSPITTYSSLIEALMADPATRQHGLRLFKDFYASRIPGSQRFPFGPNNGFGIDWKTISDPIFYLRNKFLPVDFQKAGDGWELFGNLTENRYGPETQDGWFSESRPLFVHRDAMRQFTDELREAAARHKSWKAGIGYLAAFETELGNYEKAAKLLNENVMGPNGPNLPAEAAWMLGQAVEGKSDELDRIAIQLFEHALPQIAKPGSVQQYRKPLRLSPVFRLARLYKKYDRLEAARQLLRGIVWTDNQPPLIKGYVPGVSSYCHNAGSCIACHRSERNFYGIAAYSKVMAEFGYPVDSLLSLAQIDESFSVNQEWQSKSLYKDFQKQKSNAAQAVTPRVVIEALQDGSLASAAQLDRSPLFYARRGDIDTAEKENRLLLALKPEQVRPSVIGLRLAVRGPKTKIKVFSPVIDMLKLAADYKGDGAEADKDRLDDLLRLQAEVNSNDVHAAVASTAFAFLRNDLATAKSRLEALQKMKLSEDADAQKANASLWLVARYALANDTTRSLGEALAEKALTAAKSLPTQLFKDAIYREQSEFQSKRNQE